MRKTHRTLKRTAALLLAFALLLTLPTGFATASEVYAGNDVVAAASTNLSETGQKIYAAMKAHQDDIQFDGLTTAEMDAAIDEVMAYDPVYMMACGMRAFAHIYGSSSNPISEVSMYYSAGGQETINARYEELSREIQKAMSLLTPGMTDVEKALVLHDFLCQTRLILNFV